MIQTEQEYTEAINRIEKLWGSPKGTPDGDELDRLFWETEAYQDLHHPIPEADA